MDHLSKNPGVWPCVLGGVAVGAGAALALAHAWTPSWCEVDAPPSPYAFIRSGPKPKDAAVPDCIKVTSSNFKEGDQLPAAQLSKIFGIKEGKDESPALAWSGAPKGTKSFVVTCFDPDAPTVSGFWHWVV